MRRGRLAAAILVAAVASAAAWAVFGASLLAQDRCLDAGGAWREGRCEGAR